MPAAKRTEWLGFAHQRGFDTSKIIFTPQAEAEFPSAK